MEIIIIIAILIGLIWWFFLRTPADVTFVSNKVETAPVAESVVETAQYKVPEPVATTPVPLVVEAAPVAVETAVETAVVTPMLVPPVKKPRKPRAPKAVVETVKVAAKKAAPIKKAAAKTVAVKTAPRKPRSKKV
jgi:cytoskeletal protein RodZ